MADKEETIRIANVDNGRVRVVNKADFEKNENGRYNNYEAHVDKGGETAVNLPIGVSADGRNPSGTFSEPTPTDIRYPNKDATEFENNHGMTFRKSAAEMREDKGLPDEPGGLVPGSTVKVEDSEARRGRHRLVTGEGDDKNIVADNLTDAEKAQFEALDDEGKQKFTSERMTAPRRSAKPADAKPKTERGVTNKTDDNKPASERVVSRTTPTPPSKSTP